MRAIPKSALARILDMPEMQIYCIHARRKESSPCDGRSTLEHPFGRKGGFVEIVVRCCWKHNVGVAGEEKAYNQLYAINLYGIPRLSEISWKRNWIQEKRRLESICEKNS